MIRSDPEQGLVRAQPAAQLVQAVDLSPFDKVVLGVMMGYSIDSEAEMVQDRTEGVYSSVMQKKKP